MTQCHVTLSIQLSSGDPVRLSNIIRTKFSVGADAQRQGCQERAMFADWAYCR